MLSLPNISLELGERERNIDPDDCSDSGHSAHSRRVADQSIKETEKQRRGIRKAIPGENARTREKGRGTRQTEEEEGRRGSVLRELRGGREAEVRCDRAAAREATRVRPPTPPT